MTVYVLLFCLVLFFWIALIPLWLSLPTGMFASGVLLRVVWEDLS